MKWKLAFDDPYPVPSWPSGTPYVSLGSCFATHFHKYFNAYKYKGIHNPLGIAYDPISIYRHLLLLNGSTQIEADLFIARDELICHYDMHSSMRAENTAALDNLIKEKSTAFNREMSDSSLWIITLGASIVFKYLEKDRYVANCHKQPQQLFDRIQLSIGETTDYLNKLIQQIKRMCPQSQICFTVSPVRHIRHGIIENSRSKAVLLAAVHESISSRSDCYYFPSFEIFMDELRDYRFYSSDLVHPTDEAVQYVINTWSDRVLNEKQKAQITDLKKLFNRLAHRPYTQVPDIIEKRRTEIHQLISDLEDRYPDLSFSEEKKSISG